MPSTPDGPRYVVGLQDKADTSCYKDIYECETECESLEKAQAEADANKRKTIVYDRKLFSIIHHCVSAEIKLAEEQATASAPIGKGKKAIKRK